MVSLMKFTWVLGADDTPVVFYVRFSRRLIVIFGATRCRFYFIRYALGGEIVALKLFHLFWSLVFVIHSSRKLEGCISEKNRRAVRGWTTRMKLLAVTRYAIFLSLLAAMACCLLHCTVTGMGICTSHLCELLNSTFVNWCLQMATRSWMLIKLCLRVHLSDDWLLDAYHRMLLLLQH